MSLSDSALGRVGSACRSVLVVDDELISRIMLRVRTDTDYSALISEAKKQKAILEETANA